MNFERVLLLQGPWATGALAAGAGVAAGAGFGADAGWDVTAFLAVVTLIGAGCALEVKAAVLKPTVRMAARAIAITSPVRKPDRRPAFFLAADDFAFEVPLPLAFWRLEA